MSSTQFVEGEGKRSWGTPHLKKYGSLRKLTGGFGIPGNSLASRELFTFASSGPSGMASSHGVCST